VGGVNCGRLHDTTEGGTCVEEEALTAWVVRGPDGGAAARSSTGCGGLDGRAAARSSTWHGWVAMRSGQMDMKPYPSG
jgi:hypothetical protein